MITVLENVCGLFLSIVMQTKTHLVRLILNDIQLFLLVLTVPFDLGRDLDILCVNYDTCKVFLFDFRAYVLFIIVVHVRFRLKSLFLWYFWLLILASCFCSDLLFFALFFGFSIYSNCSYFSLIFELWFNLFWI